MRNEESKYVISLDKKFERVATKYQIQTYMHRDNTCHQVCELAQELEFNSELLGSQQMVILHPALNIFGVYE